MMLRLMQGNSVFGASNGENLLSRGQVSDGFFPLTPTFEHVCPATPAAFFSRFLELGRISISRGGNLFIIQCRLPPKQVTQGQVICPCRRQSQRIPHLTDVYQRSCEIPRQPRICGRHKKSKLCSDSSFNSPVVTLCST